MTDSGVRRPAPGDDSSRGGDGRRGRVLAVNPGSSSLRVHVVDPSTLEVSDSIAVGEPPDSAAATDGLRDLLDRLDVDALAGVGYRLVHGGQRLRAPTVVDDRVLSWAEEASVWAPLHVPKALALVRTLRERFADLPHIVCPDTAFHVNLPTHAYVYAVPTQWRTQWGLRRYGFHGLSYSWALRRAAELLRRPADELNIVAAHLGGGCSICAISEGRSVDTSMGLTPLDGATMPKRSGSVDPGMLLWLLRDDRLDVEDLADGLQHHGGLLGLSDGASSDTRDLVAMAARDDAAARLALDVFCHRISREIAACATSLDRLDALVFTGEIGWNQHEVRQQVCERLALLGVDADLGGNRDDDGEISAAGVRVPVLVVRAREELQIAIETEQTVRRAGEGTPQLRTM